MNERTKKILSVAVLVILAIGAAYLLLQGQTNTYTREAAQAEGLNRSGDYVGAQNFLLEKINADSAPELKLLLANSYLEEGEAKGTRQAAAINARELLLGVERTGYSSAYLYDLLGDSANIIHDSERANAYYNKALSINPESVHSLYGLGVSYLFDGQAKKAKVYFNKAESSIAQATDDFLKTKVYIAQGRISGDLKKSEEYFEKAFTLAASKREKAELYALMSGARYLQNDMPKAIEYAELAVEADPSDANGYIAYAKAVISDKSLLEAHAPKAEAYLVKAIFLAPRSAEPQYWMGKLDASFGKYDLAIKSYDTAATFIMKDATSSVLAKASLMSDVMFDQSVVHYLKKDSRYKDFFREAFNLDVVKTLYRIRENPALKGMMTDFVS